MSDENFPITEDKARTFWHAQSDWSQATFGKDSERGPEGTIKHLIKEANEVLQDIRNLEEYVDCTFLLFESVRRAGFTFDDLFNMCFIKLHKNKKRKWPKPTPYQPVEHER